MAPTTWICDTCGMQIAQANDGYVQWQKGGGIQIVHRKDDCAKAGPPDGELSGFVGENGLMALLRLRKSYQLSPDEIDEAIKRLHIGGYDRVRSHLQDAVDNQVYEQNTPIEYPKLTDIEATGKWLDSEGL